MPSRSNTALAPRSPSISLPIPISSPPVSRPASHVPSLTASPQFDQSTLSLSPLSLTKQLSRQSSAPAAEKENELDRLGYIYSLRVAVLHDRLQELAYNHNGAFTPPIGTSPSLGGSISKFSSPWDSGSPSNYPSSDAMSKKKASFGLGKKKKTVDPETLKLPKEFIIEFWTILEAESGDQVWITAMTTFLKLTKKGTKTPSGLNLRYIPTLLDAFSQTIPASSFSNSTQHVHQSHLLQLLYNSLPRSGYFSPLSRAQSEKDKDILFRLRAEVQSYMSPPSPAAPPSRPMSSRTVSMASSRTAESDHKTRRKPSPTTFGEMIDLVGEVWSMPHELLVNDLERIKEYESLEKTYMLDLKRQLTTIGTPKTSGQKERQAHLSHQLSELLSRCSGLGDPALSMEQFPPSPPDGSSATFFVPPNRVQVFKHLCFQAGRGANALVEECRRVWTIPSNEARDDEVAYLHRAWSRSIDTASENEHGKALAVSIKGLLLDTDNQMTPVLETILDELLSLLATYVDSIFPTTDIPPRTPPASLLYLFSSAADVFFAQSQTREVLDDLKDNLRGSAVQEYVAAGMTMSSSGGEPTVEAFEQVGEWMEKEIHNIQRSWGSGLGSHLNPAAIVLGKQLPLFCAEMQTIDSRKGSSELFNLYHITSRLIGQWDQLCPEQELGFEIHAFFEPHVQAWLRETADHSVQEWVSRAIGMDNWIPQNGHTHSQSVTDLFQCIHSALQVIQTELPLSDYKRKIYLLEMSKTVSQALQQYSSTVNALFGAEMNPVKVSTPTMELQSKLGGKAGNWLAKGQQAVKSLEKKKVDGFVVPQTACTKLMDIIAAKEALSDLKGTLEAEASSSISSHRLSRRQSSRSGNNKQQFRLTILRGEGMFTKAMSKGADAFITVNESETGERLIKTQTVLGETEPKWNEAFGTSVGSTKILEISAYDRQLVGKHTLIGSTTLKLDPLAFASVGSRDMSLSMSPRGTIHVRVQLADAESEDMDHYLSTAETALMGTQQDMIRAIARTLNAVNKDTLTIQTISNLTKVLKDKKKPRAALSERELENSLYVIFEYLHANFSVFESSLSSPIRVEIMLEIWRHILDTMISLIVPPFSDKPSTSWNMLGHQETDVIFKWLQLLKTFFNAFENGKEHGVPMTKLQSGRYKDLIMLGQYMDLPSQALKERCVAAVKTASGSLGGANGNGREGERADKERLAEILLRIARTRPDMGPFLSQQVGMLTRAKMERQSSS